jgi:hypothetical protein
MIRRAITLKAAFVVLEVRVSNTIAQRLYVKYGFKTVNIKRRYYHNNGEDAYEMHLQLRSNPDYVRVFEEKYSALLARHAASDSYTEGKPPRSRAG